MNSLEVMVPATRDEAKSLLAHLGAPEHLLKHVELVSEAAESLLQTFADNQIFVDAQFVRVVAKRSEHARHTDPPGNTNNLMSLAGIDFLTLNAPNGARPC